jgi:hypothetical protein
VGCRSEPADPGYPGEVHVPTPNCPAVSSRNFRLSSGRRPTWCILFRVRFTAPGAARGPRRHRVTTEGIESARRSHHVSELVSECGPTSALTIAQLG